MSPGPLPARWRRIIERSVPPADRAHVLREVEALYAVRLEREGPEVALGWLRREALGYATMVPIERARLGIRRGLGKTVRKGGSGMDGLTGDLRYVLRVLRRSPAFALVAVISLAVGIGANTAMFGVVRTLLLTPLPVESPDELALLGWQHEGSLRISNMNSTQYVDPETGADYRSNFTYPIFRALRDGAPPGVDVFAFGFLRGVSVALGDQPALLAGGALADGGYFSVLRPPMAVGRGLTASDDTPGAPPVAVLSHAFWMRAFGGDPGIVGASLRVNGVPVEVVGITAEGFVGLSKGGFFPQTEITLPLTSQPLVAPRSSGESLLQAEQVFWLRAMARVEDGTSWETAEQALTAVLRTFPSPVVTGDGLEPRLAMLPGSQGAQPASPETARLLHFLLGVVAVVLLIACVNLASLMLARGVGRQREMALRRALGGGRTRLLRQALLESAVLAGAGTALGLLMVLLSRDLLGSLLTGSLGAGAFGNVEMRVGVDPVILGVSAGLGVAATLAFGVLPAVRLSRMDPGSLLTVRTAGPGTPRLAMTRVLLALQVGVSVPLVVGAALFLRTVSNLGAVELGFDPTGVAYFEIDPGFTQRPAEENAQLYQEILAAVGGVPGVRSVTLMENALMSGIVSNGPVEVDGERHMVHHNAVGPSFLETLGMRLLDGRMPGVQDVPGTPRVAVVNETAARELFGGSSPLGSTLQIGDRQVRIVGVVNDTPYRDRRQPVPATVFQSALQRDGFGGHHVVARVDAPVARLEPLIREAVYRVDADLPVPTIESQTEIMRQTSARERVFTQLLTAFGVFALLLASIGLHGVTSYSVTRRTSEIGVRVAVGATPGGILWLVLRQVVVLVGIGLVLGVPAALAAGPVAESLLFGVAPGDVATIVTAALTLLAVAVLAGLPPAARAARMDAMVALARD